MYTARPGARSARPFRCMPMTRPGTLSGSRCRRACLVRRCHSSRWPTASVSGEEITVPYDKGFVQSAPSIDEDGNLSQDEERELYAYYGRSDYNTTTTAGTAAGRRTGGRDETTATA